MTDCQDVQQLIGDWVDGQLEDSVRAEVVAHLTTCAACRGLGADLQRLRDAAASLGPVDPPDHVFLEVAGRIRLDAPAVGRPVPPASRRATAQWLSIAAALGLVTAGLWSISGPDVPVPADVTATNPADVVSAELDLAVAHYEKAIAALESMAATNQSPVDTGVTATLRANLGVVDRAIAESRTALVASPDNASARDSLFDALRQKVGLLQATVQLLDDVQGEDPESPPARSGRSS